MSPQILDAWMTGITHSLARVGACAKSRLHLLHPKTHLSGGTRHEPLG
jgi:hypothetical protein